MRLRRQRQDPDGVAALDEPARLPPPTSETAIEAELDALLERLGHLGRDSHDESLIAPFTAAAQEVSLSELGWDEIEPPEDGVGNGFGTEPPAASPAPPVAPSAAAPVAVPRATVPAAESRLRLDGDLERAVARADAAEEARRRLSMENGELLARVDRAESRLADLERQLELTMEERIRAADGAGGPRRRLLELEAEVDQLRAALATAQVSALAAPPAADMGDERVAAHVARIAELEAELARDSDGGLLTGPTVSVLEASIAGLRAEAEAAERRAAQAENAVAAERRNVEILEREVSAVRADRAVLQQALSAVPSGSSEARELTALRAQRDALLEERDRLRGERDTLEVRFGDLVAQLEQADATIAAAEAARDDARGFGADTARDLGEAMGDLMAARERIDGLETELNAKRETAAELDRANEALRLRMRAERDEAERTVADLARQHEVARADLVAAHAAAMAELERRLDAVEERAGEAEMRTLAVADERDGVVGELERRTSELEVAHQRLREEVQERAAVEARRDQLEEELTYLRGEILALDGARARRGIFARKPDRGRRPSPAPATAPALRTGVTAPDPSEALEAALDRRLFGE